jgi:hypothetical protein
MPDLTSFLRILGIGFLATVLSALLCFHSSLTYLTSQSSAPLLWIVVAMTVGSFLEPLIRKHPLQAEVAAIYGHVRRLIVDEAQALYGLTPPRELKSIPHLDAPSGKLTNPALYDLLAKSLYEYVIWTFPGSATYTARVNQQVRYAYYYIGIWTLYKYGVVLAVPVLLLKWLVLNPDNRISHLLLYSTINLDTLNSQLLLGSNNFLYTLIVSVSAIVIIAPLAIFFRRLGCSTMLVELYSRHAIIATNAESIRSAARKILTDPFLLEDYSNLAQRK